MPSAPPVSVFCRAHGEKARGHETGDGACKAIMRRYRPATKRDAVNFARCDSSHPSRSTRTRRAGPLRKPWASMSSAPSAASSCICRARHPTWRRGDTSHSRSARPPDSALPRRTLPPGALPGRINRANQRSPRRRPFVSAIAGRPAPTSRLRPRETSPRTSSQPRLTPCLRLNVGPHE